MPGAALRVRRSHSRATKSDVVSQASVIPIGRDGARYALGFADLTEEVSIAELPVVGAWPKWMAGTLLRTGPAKFDLGRQTVDHWFDGLAMLYRFGFADGKVSYANRFLESDVYRNAKQEGRLTLGGFATDPSVSLVQRVLSAFSGRRSDNCNVAINAFAHCAIALTETRTPLRFDQETLDTIGPFEIDGDIGGTLSTAHPHYDAWRKRHYSYFVDFGRTSAYRLYSIDDETGLQTELAEMAVDRPAYMHSFAMTENYLVLAEVPFVVNPLHFFLRRQPFIRNYHWEPERGLRFQIFEKDGGRHLKTIETEAAFTFHHVNAHERVDEIVVDLVAYPDDHIIDEFYLPALREGRPVNGTGLLARYHLPLGGEAPVRREVLSRKPIELPRIDYPRVAGRPYRIVWGVSTRRQGHFFDSIVKIDVEDRTARDWWDDCCYPGEPVFVPRPRAVAEDDGVLLSVVLDARRRRSFLLMLDAASLGEIARAECPHPIPFGLHGNYFPGTDGEMSLRQIHR